MRCADILRFRFNDACFTCLVLNLRSAAHISIVGFEIATVIRASLRPGGYGLHDLPQDCRYVVLTIAN